jgi:hypothetical protein
VHHAFIAATLEFVGFGPIRERTVYGVRTLSPKDRARALDRAREDGASDAKRAADARPLLAAASTR